MNGTAFRTLPLAVIKSQVVVDETANMTSFAGRKESVKLVNMATIPLAFIFKHIDESIPSSISDRFSKMVISDHVSNSEVFNMYRLVIADKLPACLMKKITSPIRDFLVLYSKFMNGFGSGIRAFLLPRHRSLKPIKPFLGLAVILWAFNDLAVRSCEESLETEINTDRATDVFWFWYINLAQNGCKVFPRRATRDSNRLHYPFNRSVKNDLNPCAFGDIEASRGNRPVLWNRKGLLIPLLFEVREFGAFIKEVVVSSVKVAKCLLQRLGVDLFEPFKFWEFFKFGQ